MADYKDYKLVNIKQLEADLATIGDSIRNKSGLTGKLSFPSGMKSVLDSISGGEGRYCWRKQIKSGDQTNHTWSPINSSTVIEDNGLGNVVITKASGLSAKWTDSMAISDITAMISEGPTISYTVGSLSSSDDFIFGFIDAEAYPKQSFSGIDYSKIAYGVRVDYKTAYVYVAGALKSTITTNLSTGYYIQININAQGVASISLNGLETTSYELPSSITSVYAGAILYQPNMTIRTLTMTAGGLQHIGYVVSDDSSAYPTNDYKDGYYYTLQDADDYADAVAALAALGV